MAENSKIEWTDQSGQDRYTTEVVVQGFGGVMTMLDSAQGNGNRPPPPEGPDDYGRPGGGAGGAPSDQTGYEADAMLPTIALSVRQPWAWAIVAGLKDIENRSTAFRRRRVAVHASKGMTRDEYEDAREHMARLGIDCPRPDELPRGAIVGAVTVTAVVDRSASPWFFGPRGLVLADAVSVHPIPAAGALGYFPWKEGGALAEPLKWMAAWPGTATPARRPKAPAPAPLFD